MGIEALRQTLLQAGPAALWLALATGFVFSFNPVALAVIPVSLAYVTRARTPRQATLYGLCFVLGMLFTHALLGLVASLGGEWVQAVLGRIWGLALGPLLIALGLIWLGWLRLPLPALALRARPVTNAWGAFALGIPFSVAICPVCTPALVVMLGVAAAIGSVGFGVALLLAFALGRTMPILIGAVAIGWLEHLTWLRPWHRRFEIAGGVLLILSGLYLLNAYLLLVPEWAV